MQIKINAEEWAIVVEALGIHVRDLNVAVAQDSGISKQFLANSARAAKALLDRFNKLEDK